MSQGERILLADDDLQRREMLTDFLTEQGYEVVAAPDGLQAMDLLKAQGCQLAILDLKLPGCSGLDLLSYIKTNLPDTEVIICNGPEAGDSATQALRLGACDCLPQGDLRRDYFQAVVARALAQRHLAQSNRELLLNLRRAQEELTQQRLAELTQVRRIGEALAVPLTWEQLFHGLINVIWESMSLEVLGVEFQGVMKESSLEAYRRQQWLEERVFEEFKKWLKKHFDLITEHAPLCVVEASASPMLPLPSILCEKAQAGEVLAMIAAGRETPFSPKEQELFRIFILQGEAALKNLVLFEQVKSLAIHDGLTGLYNYRHFWEILTHEVEISRRYEQPLSLLFLDLDNFKAINDALGHPQGDVILKTLASYLKDAVRQADIVCRYGGEEFVVILPRTGAEQALVSAERLRQQIGELSFPLPRENLQITVSIGLAGLHPGMDGAELLNAADSALYRAKEAGRNQVCAAP